MECVLTSFFTSAQESFTASNSSPVRALEALCTYLIVLGAYVEGVPKIHPNNHTQPAMKLSKICFHKLLAMIMRLKE